MYFKLIIVSYYKHILEGIQSCIESNRNLDNPPAVPV